ncbi:MAG: SDR family NAD(P)-dependent oxidoreductase [Immundisolibacterales bacterium]|nr:SDR family NAD(P)-dependent oxidoreductase [Immundisolibacterales bacterium]
MRLEGMTVAITGAQQGIGAGIARAVAREGANVVVNWLDDESQARAVADDVAAAGARAVLVPGSVTDWEAVRKIVEAGVELGGSSGLTGFVNNAGIFPRVPFLELADDDWDAVHDVNLKGTFRCSQAAAKAMIEGGNGGSVVNLASVAAFRCSPNGVHYAASKAGVIGLTRATALDLAPHRIRVNAIAPGTVDTAQPRYGMSEEELAALGPTLPLGRIGSPEDVASLAVFLLSGESAHITGQTLHVNGGQFLY